MQTSNIIELDIPGLPHRLRMRVHERGDQMISETLRREKIWEPYETSLMLDYPDAGDVFVDVGANIGYYTLLAAQRVGPKGKVFAYEPNPENFALLKDNIELNQLHNVHSFPWALYDDDKEGALYLSASNYGDHRIYDTGKAHTADRARQPIALVHGGQHLGKLTQHIDFLKIDTQGAEYYVMHGLHDLILQNRAHIHVVLEFCPWGIRHSGADGHALVNLLDELDMTIDIIDHQQSCLIPAQTHHLRQWVTDMLKEPDNEGFVNLLLTPKKLF